MTLVGRTGPRGRNGTLRATTARDGTTPVTGPAGAIGFSYDAFPMGGCRRESRGASDCGDTSSAKALCICGSYESPLPLIQMPEENLIPRR